MKYNLILLFLLPPLLAEDERRPQIDKRQRVVEANVGSPFELNCKVSEDHGALIIWKYARNESITPTNLGVIGPSLRYPTVKAGAGGFYTCVVINAFGVDEFTMELKTAPLYSEEDGRPQIDKRKRVIEAVIGEPIVLNCTVVKGHPVDIYLGYAKSLENFPKPSQYYPKASYRIPSVHPSHAGFYGCTAVNYLGEDTFIVELKPVPALTYKNKDGPEIAKRQRVIYAKAGEQLELNCRVTKGEGALIIWKYLKNSNLYPMHLDVTGPTLIIPNVQKKDAGYYICIAVNAFGEDKYTIEVKL